MTTAAELREQYPDVYGATSDFEMVDLLASRLGKSRVYAAWKLGLPLEDYAQNESNSQDFGTDLAIGGAEALRGVAGVANIAAAPFTDQQLITTPGLDEYIQRQQSNLSPNRQRAQGELDQAWEDGGFWNIAGEYASEPAYLAGMGLQSAPGMVAGGVGGMALRGAARLGAGALSRGLGAAAPYIGEGGIAGGMDYAQMVEQGVAPREAAGYSALAGAGVGALGGVGGAFANRMGVTDVSRALSGARRVEGDVPLSYGRQLGYGALSESGQEVLQSPWEQAMQNLATDQPVTEGLARSAVEGGILGGVMGAGFNAIPRGRGQELDLTQDRGLIDPARPFAGVPGGDTAAESPQARRQADLEAAFGAEEQNLNLGSGHFDADLGRELTLGELPSEVYDAKLGRNLTHAELITNPDYQGTVAKPATPAAPKAAAAAKPSTPENPTLAALQQRYAANPTWPTKGLLNAKGEVIPGFAKTRLPALQVLIGQNPPDIAIARLRAEQEDVNKRKTEYAPHVSRLIDVLIAEQEAKLAAKGQTTSPKADTAGTVPEPVVQAQQPQTTSVVPPQGVAPEPAVAPTTGTSLADLAARGKARVAPGGEQVDLTQDPRPVEDAPLPAVKAPRVPKQQGRSAIASGMGSTTVAAPVGAAPQGVAELSTPEQVDAAVKQRYTDLIMTLPWATPGNSVRLRAGQDPAVAAAALRDAFLGLISSAMDSRGQGIAGEGSRAVAEKLQKLGILTVNNGKATLTHTWVNDQVKALSALAKQDPVLSHLNAKRRALAEDAAAAERAGALGAVNPAGEYSLEDRGAELSDSFRDAEADLLTASANLTQDADSDALTSDKGTSELFSEGLRIEKGAKKGSGAPVDSGTVLTKEMKALWAKANDLTPEQADAELKALRPHRPAIAAVIESKGTMKSGVKQDGTATNTVKGQTDKALLENLRGLRAKLLTDAPVTPERKADLEAEAEQARQVAREEEIAKDEAVYKDSTGIPQFLANSWRRQAILHDVVGVPNLVELRARLPLAYNQVVQLWNIATPTSKKLILAEIANEYRKIAPVAPAAEAVAGDAAQREVDRPATGGQDPGDSAQPGARAAPTVVTKKRRVAQPGASDSPTRQQGQAPTPQAATTGAKLRQVIRGLLGTDEHWRVNIYETAQEAEAAGQDVPETAYGWVDVDRKGVKHAYFIAERIQAGTELGKFLHEVGAHIGIENILDGKQLAQLYGRIEQWAKATDGSVEAKAAKLALARVAESGVTERDDQRSEGIAYFLEELVNAGVDPTALNTSTPLGRWFRTLWAAFKAALRKLRVQNIDRLTGQDVVDLAYGAARLDLNTRWHGTAAKFRKFNSAYMSTGAGGQWYSWGHYVAKRHGVGSHYMDMAVRDKAKPEEVMFDGKPGIRGTPHAYREIAAAVVKHSKNNPGKPVGHSVISVGRRLRAEIRYHESGNFEDGVSRETVDDWKAQVKWLETNAAKFSIGGGKPEGSLFNVDVDARPEEILHWDLPFSEQPEYVQNTLKEAMFNDELPVPGGKGIEILDDTTGQEIMQRLVASLQGKSQARADQVNGNHYSSPEGKAASLYLDSLGIKGMEHYDEPSRSGKVPKNQRTTNLVVFNDKNIYRVARGPDGKTAPGKRQFGQETPAARERRGLDVSVPPIDAANQWLQQEFKSGKTLGEHATLGWLTMEQIAERYGAQVPALRAINTAIGTMEAMAKKWVGKAEHIDRLWQQLSKAQDKLLSETMIAASLAGYDPDVGKTKGVKTAEEVALDRQWQHLQALDKGAKVPAVSIYRAVRNHFEQDLAEVKAHLKALKGKERTPQVDALIGALEGLSKGAQKPYFPLMRLGGYYTVGRSPELQALHDKRGANDDGLSDVEEKRYEALRKDGKHYVVSSHSRLANAERHRDKLIAQGMTAFANTAQERGAKHRSSIVEDMKTFDNAIKDLNLDAGVKKQLEQVYEGLLISSLPEGHVLKKNLRRDGIIGADTDMRRVVATSANSRAYALSRLRHARDVQEALGELRAASADGNNTERALANELVRRTNLAYEHYQDSPIITAMTTASYMGMLGASPAFWLINLTQVPLITAPWLAARTNKGFTATLRDLGVAAKQASQMIKWTTDGQWRAEFKLDNPPKGVTADEIRMFRDLEDAGQLDFTLAFDLGQVAAGKSGKFWNALRSLNAPTNATELINRGGTALAAYRGYLAAHPSTGTDEKSVEARHKAAVGFAKQATNTTQINYNPANAARHMQSVFGSRGLAKVMFQFWTYQQGMTYLALSTLKDAVAGDKTAQKTMAYMTGTLVATAGIFGLPFASMVLSAASWALSQAGDDDEPVDLEVGIKNLLHDLMPGIDTLLTKGAPGALLGVDLSARTGQGNLMNPLAYARFGAKDTGTDTIQELMFRVFGGASAGTAASVVDGVMAIADGDLLKGVEKIGPLKAVKDLAKFAQLQGEGVKTGSGEQALGPDVFHAGNLLAQAMGFSPTKKSLYYESNAAIQNVKQAVDGVRTKLLSRYAQAFIAGKGFTDIHKEIQAFNQRHPERKISWTNMTQSVKQRRTNRQERLASGVAGGKDNQAFQQYGRFAQ